MINYIKCKIKRLKLKVYMAMNCSFEDTIQIKDMSRNTKIKYYFKKIFNNPKRFFYNLLGNKFEINYLEIALTTVCTLNCKGCSALMNYYTKKSHIDLEINLNSLSRVLSACDSIRRLRLLGGEPLCYDKLYEVLCFISQQDKIKRTTIVTNGTLLIKDERIIKILQSKRFDIFISNYGSNSKKKDELINQLKENNIQYILGNEDFLWRDYGDLECRNRSKGALKKQYQNCKIMCYSLLEGNLHRCPRSSHGTNLKKIPLKEKDYIDLLDENITKEQLRKKLKKFYYGYTPYIEACNYCNSGTKELKSMPAGEQHIKR